MKTDYQTKVIGKSDEKVKELIPVTIEYNFPAEGVTVEASSLEEALEKLKAIKNKKQ